MQILNDQIQVQRFLQNLQGCMEKDSFCWEGWHMLHVMPQETLEGFSESDLPLAVAKLLRLLLPDGDGAILLVPDGSLLALIHAGENTNPFEDLLEGLNHSTDIRIPALHLLGFDIERERQTVIAMLEMYSGDIFDVSLPKEDAQESMLYSLAPHLGNFMSAWSYLTHGRTSRKKPHLLVVDDDPLTRRIVRSALADHYPVVTATCAAEAVEKHLLLVPDIIFLDIGLPDCDGFRILDHIRACDPDCSVIMFSGNSFLENRLRALSHGADGFLPKPFNRLHFEHFISDWMREHQAA